MILEDILNNYNEFVITDIAVQKKDNNRFSVFLNKHFAFGISYETYENFLLKIDVVLSREKVEEILLFEKVQKAKVGALKYIGVKARTEFELRKKLRTQEHELEIIDKIVDDFKERKYIDDRDFSELYVRDFVNFKKDGIFKLRRNLQQKGIKSEIIEEVIKQYVSSDDQFKKALQLGLRKFDFLRDKENKKEKIYRFLIQKGFESPIVSRVLSEILTD